MISSVDEVSRWVLRQFVKHYVSFGNDTFQVFGINVPKFECRACNLTSKWIVWI